MRKNTKGVQNEETMKAGERDETMAVAAAIESEERNLTNVESSRTSVKIEEKRGVCDYERR